MKIPSLIFLAALVVLFGSSVASAHVVVKPNQVGVGAFQTFTVGVPVEKDNPAIALRLVIPEGVKFVTPSVKPGWTINVKHVDQDFNAADVAEISWTGGSIPAGQRDDFSFSAQVPAVATTLQWKAYQTYQNGDVVSWDQDPAKASSGDDENVTPYSQTQVVNDLATSSTKNTATSLSILALIISIAALAVNYRR